MNCKKITLLSLLLVALLISTNACISNNPFSNSPFSKKGSIGETSISDVSDNSDVSNNNENSKQNSSDSYNSNDLNIPFPSSLKISENESLTFKHQNEKAGLTVLSGATNVNTINNFFLNQLPKNGWALLSEVGYGGTRVNTWQNNNFILTTIVKEAPILGIKSHSRVELWKAPRRN